ncbi:MAG: phosphate ABC transporter permease subunit PstC [Treponema sp.]|nr:phosphate ABC transporter permease subunit PstC [Treponema sp.]
MNQRTHASLQAIRETCMHGVFFFSAVVAILALALICFFLLVNGLPAIGTIGISPFLFTQEWSPTNVPSAFGILPMIVGSLYVTAGAISIGVPIGILTAVFLAQGCPDKLYRVVKPAIELLAGIPSVVYGLFGIGAIVPIIGNSILSASVLLGIMILPTVIVIAESALRAVPEQYYEGARALGAGHYRAVFYAILPAAKSGVFAGVVLSVGRAVGETMAVVMVAGNQARMPVSLLKGVRTLTANIVIEMGYAADLHRGALIGTGVVLFVCIIVINLSVRLLQHEESIPLH